MDNFQKYKLKENPFDIFTHEHKMANRQKDWDNITSSLRAAFDGTAPRYFVLLGDYGFGKSFMFEQIYMWLSKSHNRQVFTSRVYFEKRIPIQESEPRWSKFGLDIVMRIFDNIEREKLIELLKNVKLSSFKSKYTKLFEALKENKEVAFMYVIGGKLLKKDLDELGVQSPITDSHTSLMLFFEFLRLLNLTGYSSFLLLLDEFEFIATLGDKKITQILQTFRQIFDDFGSYVSKYKGEIAKPICMFATSPGGWDKLKELEANARKKTGGAGIAPFMERVSPKDIIRLAAFSEEHSIELVKLRLSEKRTTSVNDPLFPFTKEAVRYVHGLSFNKPRNIIQYCGILVEDALELGLDKIDENNAKKILDKYGIFSTSSNPK